MAYIPITSRLISSKPKRKLFNKLAPRQPKAEQRSTSRKAAKAQFFEPLESRELLSATWSTTDVYTAPGGAVTGTAADSAGNVYMSGVTGGNTYFVREKAADSTGWATIFTTPAPIAPDRNDLAVDAAGDLFFGSNTPADANGVYHWQIREKPAGQSTFAVIDDVPGGIGVSLAADGAGDAYALGLMTIKTVTKGKTTTTMEQVVRKYVPVAGGFAVSNMYQTPGGSDNLKDVAVVNKGAAAGVYILNNNNGTWNVIKSANGGQTWSQVDQFDFDSTIGNANTPIALIADPSGNLFVAGAAEKATITGYDSKNRPIYTNIGHWLVRKSVNGGISWSIDDDYRLVTLVGASPTAIGTDLAGNVYVAGIANDNSGMLHAIIRTNAGGSWTTSDDYTGQTHSVFEGFTTGADGTLYAVGRGGQAATQDFFTRSAPDPTAPAQSPATTLFSATAISDPSLATDVIGV